MSSKKHPAMLYEILALENFNLEQEQVAYCKILAYGGCFDKPELSNTISRKTFEVLVEPAVKAKAIWQATSLSQKNTSFCGNIITDSEAINLLNTEFPSLEEGFFWLSTVKDIHLLRKEFYDEGVGQQKEQVGINTQRWLRPEKTENGISELYHCAKTLHLVDTIPWPNTSVKHLVFICSLEQFIIERIKFIAESYADPCEYFYVLTGPRGLFNFEKALPALLAEWFDKPDEEYKIQAVLEQCTENSPLQWTRDLSGLKKAIMQAMGVDKWPTNSESYYYKDKAIYDSAAVESGRQLLDCEGGPWPVTLDLVHYYLNKLLAPKLDVSKIKIIPVIAKGKKGRLARNDDTVEAWYHSFGKDLLVHGEKPLFIACNSMHTIPFVMQNLWNTSYYQDAITSHEIREKINEYSNNATQGKTTSFSKITSQILIAGPGAKTFNLDWMFDSLAKLSFAMRASIKLIIEEKLIEEEEQSIQISSMQKMILYNTIHPIKLIRSTIDLANVYYLRQDFVKISGLFNFAINVAKKIQKNDIIPMLQDLKDATLVNILTFIRASQQRLKGAVPQKDTDLSVLRVIYDKNLHKLADIRQKLLQEFSSINADDNLKIKLLYDHCYQLMSEFFVSLIEESYIFVGKPQEQLAFIYFGSYSRKQATPFSDVEFGIVSESDDITHPKELTKFLLLMIINLGETVLSSLGISAYNSNGNKVSLNGHLYDNYTPDGYSFDQNIAQSCKSPLGKKVDGNVIYRLIGTPSTLSSLFCSDAGYKVDPYLPQIGMLSEFAYGATTLYQEFQTQMAANYRSSYYGLSLLERDIEKYLPSLNAAVQVFNHKKYFYRPLSVLIDNIYTCYNPSNNCDTPQKINKLYTYKALNLLQTATLQKALIFSMYLRFKLHYKYDEQKVDLFSDAPEFKQVNIVRHNLSGLFGFFSKKVNKFKISRLSQEHQLAEDVIENNKLIHL